MSGKILTVEGGAVKEHEIKSDEERNSEILYKALSSYMGVPDERTPDNILATAVGAIEYACVVGSQLNVSEDIFLDLVTNVWKRLTTERPVRE